MQDLLSNTNKTYNYNMDLPDADIIMFPNFFSSIKIDALFKELKEPTTWKQKTISLYGKEIDLPRLTAW